MAELISQEQPRVKFALHEQGGYVPADTPQLRGLSRLMALCEQRGCVPILNDGLVGGNCAMALSAAGAQPPPQRAGQLERALEAAPLLISRSGKAPGVALRPARDFVLLSEFDAAGWSAQYSPPAPGLRPSSDAPLHAAALGAGAAQRYGWGAAPALALHGHALAEGEGLEAARRLGLPISHRETLFSTPEDLAELEALFRAFPYPAHRLWVRRGHGFFLLGSSLEGLAADLQEGVLAHLPGGSGSAGDAAAS